MINLNDRTSKGCATRILIGDVTSRLKDIPDKSIHMVCTSPPYFGLRSYLPDGHPDKYKEIGLEKTPQEYVENLLAVFREVKRVLREDGVVFLNLGDSYCSPNGRSGGGEYGRGPNSRLSHMHDAQEKGIVRKWPSLKPKDLIGIPWRVAFALQDDGWWLRSDIIWSKGNPMPESVTDRCTNSHEYVFMLTKAARYFFDQEAVKESCSDATLNDGRTQRGTRGQQGVYSAVNGNCGYRPSGRNRRSVWSINTQPFPGSHFAVMPPNLAETCILAGTSEAGCCSQCGKPLERIIEKDNPPNDGATDSAYQKGMAANRLAMKRQAARERGEEYVNRTKTLGFRPACTCNAPTIPCTVLDPFGGSGTTGEVAQRLGRDAILIELNPDYLPLIDQRTRQSGLALA